MAAAARQGDMCTGHNGWPPRPATSGSGDVTINGMPAHRVGDAWAPHTKPSNGTHAGTLAGGSSTVFVNGKGLGRVGDPISCGSSVAQGSSNVFAG